MWKTLGLAVLIAFANSFLSSFYELEDSPVSRVTLDMTVHDWVSQ